MGSLGYLLGDPIFMLFYLEETFTRMEEFRLYPVTTLV